MTITGMMESRPIFFREDRWSLPHALLLLGIAACNGCAKPAETTAIEVPALETTDAPVQKLAASVPTAQGLIERYRQLDQYTDQLEVDLIYHLDDGRTEVTTTTITTSFARPNRLRLDVTSDNNQVQIVSDGQQFVSRILDPVTKDFDGQVVVRNAPPTCTISHLYGVTELVDPTIPDERLSALLGAPISLDMTPLGLLLGEGKLVQLLQTAHKKISDRAPSGPTEGDDYQTIECQTAEGLYRFWIESGSGLISRLDYPSSTQGLPPGLQRVELVARVREARLEAADGRFDINTAGRPVQHFVLPPLPPSTKLLGQRVAQLVFESERESLVIDNGPDEIAVVVWLRDHPSSRLVAEQLDRLRSQFGNSRTRFVPVIVDASRLQKVVDRWTMGSRIWVDSLASGRDVLEVTQAPTTVVLGPNNTVQYFEIGANPNIGAAVAAVLSRLQTGKSVAEETLRTIHVARTAYSRQLELAASRRGSTIELLLGPPKEPARLILKERWRQADVREPGNLLVLPGKPKQVIVLEGWSSLVFLNLEGEILRRIPLQLSLGEGISQLRAGKDDNDRALLAAVSSDGTRAFVFDLDGKLLMHYPKTSQQAAIADVAMLEAGPDHVPSLVVAWRETLGLHAADLRGNRIWANRALSSITGLSVINRGSDNSPRSLLVTSETNIPFLVDQGGRTVGQVPDIPVGTYRVATWPGNALGFYSLVSQTTLSPTEQAAIRCCFTRSADGTRNVTAVNHDWQAVWSYQLPSGVFRNQPDHPQTIALPSIGPTWMFLGVDGSFHLVSADGKFEDSFSRGQHIRGFAGMNVGDVPILVLSSDAGIAAYEVSLRN